LYKRRALYLLAGLFMPHFLLNRITTTQITIFFTVFSYLSLVPFLFSSDFSQIHSAWTTASELTHGYPVLLIALSLIVRNSKHYVGKADWRMLVPLFTIVVAYAVADILAIKTIKLLAILAALPVFLAVVLGGKSLRFTLIPTLIIGMALPATYLAIPLLQKLTVIANTYLVKQVGMTAYIEGAYIHLTSGVIWVKNGCSGHKYFTSAITLALIMISLDRFTKPRAFVIMALALGLSLLANWIRVFLLVLVAYRTSVDHPLIHDHDNFGWVVFGIAMIPLFLYWRNCPPLQQEKSETTPTILHSPPQKLAVYGLAGVLIMIFPLAVSSRLRQTDAAHYPPLEASSFLSNYQAIDEQPPPWQPLYKGADYSMRLTHKTKPIILAIDQYNQQGKNKELDNSENKIFAKGWRELSNAPFLIPLNQKEPLRAISKSARHYRHGTYVVLYWHSVNGAAVSPGFRSKLQLLSKLGNNKAPDYLFALASRCGENCEQALALLDQEAQDLLNQKSSLD